MVGIDDQTIAQAKEAGVVLLEGPYVFKEMSMNSARNSQKTTGLGCKVLAGGDRGHYRTDLRLLSGGPLGTGGEKLPASSR